MAVYERDFGRDLIFTFQNVWRAVQLFSRCQSSLGADDSALTSSPVDVTSKCPLPPRATLTADYVRATSYLACDYAVPSCRHHPFAAGHRPTSLCHSHLDRRMAGLDVVTSHTAADTASGGADQNDINDDDNNDDENSRRRLSTSRCHCVRHSHVTQFGTFSQSPLQFPVDPPT